MSTNLPAILGATAGAVGLLLFVAILICLWVLRKKITRTSESSSTDLSPQVARNDDVEMTRSIFYPSVSPGARCFSLEDLNKATKNFSEMNLIGQGKFGKVYKGLILDMIVAVKSRLASPSQEFVDEVLKLSLIRHRNLVSLVGYCQESGMQMLVFEYIPNGSISYHLFGPQHASNGRLEFKHRLSIAHRAAKGLAHLHSLNPPVIHMDFKTSNVLVDENFIPKVADFGLHNFLRAEDIAGPSQVPPDSQFLELGTHGSQFFTEKTDVYSFGIFLLELLSGTEALQLQLKMPNQAIREWAREYDASRDNSVLIDFKMARSFTEEGVRDYLSLVSLCLSEEDSKRPSMNLVGSELERILDREMSSTTIMGEGSPTMTLGSELFTSSS
ncbi:serine/threonine-protein kinase CDG1-like isoform X2 [Wolffia australiana]